MNRPIGHLLTVWPLTNGAAPSARTWQLLRTVSGRLLLISAAASFLLLFGCAAQRQPELPLATPSAAVVSDKQVAELGIEVVAIRRTAGGNMLDFRFKVLSPDKAMPLFREDIYPYLIDQKTEIPLKVTDTTKVGPMRPTSRDPRAGKVYFMFFRNPNRFIQTGQRVTVVVGDHKIRDLEVL